MDVRGEAEPGPRLDVAKAEIWISLGKEFVAGFPEKGAL